MVYNQPVSMHAGALDRASLLLAQQQPVLSRHVRLTCIIPETADLAF